MITGYAIVALFSVGILFGFTNVKTTGFQNNQWVAPKSADTIQNPLKGNADAVAAGKKLFNNMCITCHGQDGKGDGVAAAGLTPKPANFCTSFVEHEKDGDLFWKMTTGNAPMASYKQILSRTQRWQLVDYIRSMEQKSLKAKK